MPKFLQDLEGDFLLVNSKKNKRMSGQKLYEILKGKKEVTANKL